MARQSARFDLRLYPELREAAEKIAKAQDRTLAWVLRDALERYIREQEISQAVQEP
jgi:predicted DNA-binding protein